MHAALANPLVQPTLPNPRTELMIRSAAVRSASLKIRREAQEAAYEARRARITSLTLQRKLVDDATQRIHRALTLLG